MSEESSEVEDLYDVSSINVELESEESLSTISSSPSHILDIGLFASKNIPNSHIVHQLFQRESGHGSSNKILRPPIKTYALSKILPKRALRGQVFMGTTRCGRFLMTYSTLFFDPIGEDWYGSVYKYRLHWWAFALDGHAREIGSVLLFGNARISAPLQIFICQWPTFNNKILVYGLMQDTGNMEAGAVPTNQRAYVTVTAVPTVGRCSACSATAEYFILNDLASPKKEPKCLEHSFTVHTSFDIAIPYPEFSPKVNLKFEDYCVFNTNNALHAIRVDLDDGEKMIEPEVETDDFVNLTVQVAPTPSPPRPTQSRLQELIIRDFADDASLTPKRIVEDSCLSPPMPTRVKSFSDAEPSQSSFSEGWRRLDNEGTFLAPRIFFKVKKCGMKRLGFRPIFSRRKTSLSLYLDSRKNSPYEFVDDSPSEVEKLSQFRRKRLADKTYEFQDCDSENIVPFSQARIRPGGSESESESHLQVLRPMNRNTPQRSRPMRLSDKLNMAKRAQDNFPRIETGVAEGDIIIHDLSGRYIDYTPDEEILLRGGLRRMAHCFRGVATRYTRHYHEDDEERASVVTADMEDDDGSAVAGYHTALNLEVKGPGYCPLHMIHHGKSGRIGGKVVRVEQQSLDIEVICHSVATSLCMVANKTFTFCNDYDVEVVDVCPRTGDVLVLLMMRIEGCDGKKEEGSPMIQYETSVTLVWNLLKADYRITMVVPPQKVSWDEKAVWNPAREASRKLRASLPADVTMTDPAVRVWSNSSYLRGVSLTRLQDLENCVQFVL